MGSVLGISKFLGRLGICEKDPVKKRKRSATKTITVKTEVSATKARKNLFLNRKVMPIA